MNKALELAKQAGAVSYTNRHYPDRPYRTFGPEELQKFYILARADYETKLSAVMPADFKDWHENNRSEWPEVAAWVITNLREQRADLEAENAKLRNALERVYVTCDWHGDDGRDAMQAARAALGEK